jgi:hypothetical protein
MSRLRFVTARDLIEAFPNIESELAVEPTDEPSLNFVETLAAQDQSKAVSFLAHLLPRREAVWWACQSVRALAPERTPNEEAALLAAEEWVKQPEDEKRQQALQHGTGGKHLSPTTWLALAAAWASNQTPEGFPIPPQQTAKAAGTAIIVAGSKLFPAQRDPAIRKCIDNGKRMAEGELR